MFSYHIDKKDLPLFLQTMTRRRVGRIRNGAHHWTLLCDVEHPQLWIETYKFSTWVDYLRHNKRRLPADVDDWGILSSLDKSPDGITINRMIEQQNVPDAEDIKLSEPSRAQPLPKG